MKESIEVNNKGMSLEEFIVQNDKMLSALGVFFAIVAFSKVTTNWALSIVTFASLCGLVLIWYEVLGKISKKMSLRLYLFRFALIIIGAGIILYWVSEFRVFWDAFLWIPTEFVFFSIIYFTLLPIVRRFKITRDLLGIDSKKKELQHVLVRVLALLIILILSFIYAVPISIVANVIFDAIKKIN